MVPAPVDRCRDRTEGFGGRDFGPSDSERDGDAPPLMNVAAGAAALAAARGDKRARPHRRLPLAQRTTCESPDARAQTSAFAGAESASRASEHGRFVVGSPPRLARPFRTSSDRLIDHRLRCNPPAGAATSHGVFVLLNRSISCSFSILNLLLPARSRSPLCIWPRHKHL